MPRSLNRGSCHGVDRPPMPSLRATSGAMSWPRLACRDCVGEHLLRLLGRDLAALDVGHEVVGRRASENMFEIDAACAEGSRHRGHADDRFIPPPPPAPPTPPAGAVPIALAIAALMTLPICAAAMSLVISCLR